MAQISSKQDLPYFYTSVFWVGIDCFVNILALQWQFTFWKQDWYDRICHYPHRFFKQFALDLESLQGQQSQSTLTNPVDIYLSGSASCNNVN